MSQELLRQAYNLIQQERLDEAVGIIRRVLNTQPNSADAWWLLANAVTEPTDAAEALSNVLRYNPNHAEARAVYDQLISEYPELAEQDDAYGDFGEPTAYELVAATRAGATAMPNLDNPEPERNELDDLFGGDFNVDQLLASSPSGVQNPPRVANSNPSDESWLQPSNPSSDIDLDAMFGGTAVMDVPATANEDRDLDEMFFGGATQSNTPTTAVKTDSERNLDQLLTAFEDTVPNPAVKPMLPETSSSTGDADLDALFNDPAFVKDLDKQEQKGRRGRRRRKEEQAQPEFPADEPEPQPAKPEPSKKTRTQERPAVELRPNVTAYDPFSAEQRTNRRNPLFAVISLLVIVAIVAGAMVFLPRLLNNDPVTIAAQNVQANLGGFNDVRAEGAGDVFRVSVCSTPGRALQAKVYEAMERVADNLGDAATVVKSAQIVVADCADATRILYRATAPVDAIVRYVQTQKQDVRAYRAAWINQ